MPIAFFPQLTRKDHSFSRSLPSSGFFRYILYATELHGWGRAAGFHMKKMALEGQTSEFGYHGYPDIQCIHV